VQYHAHPQQGYTLIELVLAISLIGIMAGMLAPLAASAVRAHQTTQSRLVAQDMLRYAVERIARELREVSYDTPSGFALAGTLTATPASQVTFTRRYYDSAGTASASATIQLLQSGSEVRLSDSRYTSLGAQVLCDQVAALQFTWLDEAGRAMAAPTATTVFAVEITLTLNSTGYGLSQSTRVQLRNRETT
jgi:prepilin-type N-terminal cleavage/methylation domain-containing protein